MPAAARAQGTDSVFSLTGAGYKCMVPTNTKTGDAGSPTVSINGKPAVRKGDKVGPHSAAGCSPDTSSLSTGSSTVKIDGQPAGRIGDQYGGDNFIISGSHNVFIG